MAESCTDGLSLHLAKQGRRTCYRSYSSQLGRMGERSDAQLLERLVRVSCFVANGAQMNQGTSYSNRQALDFVELSAGHVFGISIAESLAFLRCLSRDFCCAARFVTLV